MPEIIALRMVATELLKQLDLLGPFNALGQYLEPQAVAEADDRAG